MKDQFIPYEQALELEELGFNEKCFGHYMTKESWKLDLCEGSFYYDLPPCKDKNSEYSCRAPLWQQAFDWFMSNYKLFPKIDQYYGERFYVNIEDMNFPRLYSSDKLRDLGEYPSYEEACLKCLKKLIEIVKNG